MQFHEKLQDLRKGRGFSQEELAERLSVTRQAISKCEGGSAYPEIEKLVQLSEIFGVTLDSLMKEAPIEYGSAGGSRSGYAEDFPFQRPYWGRGGYEYKSKRTLFGLPLVHINIGFGMRRAKGILAIGTIARGFVSLGLLSLGLLSFGILSLGLIGIGAVGIGLLLAVGSIAIGTVAIGALAIGVLTLGALAIGMFSTGALAVASHIAVGHTAYGHVAIGEMTANGVRTFLVEPGGNFSLISRAEVQAAIYEEFPNLWSGIVRWMTFMFG
jgi:transcriptional regulator with XRE-family HTH domain